MPRPSYRRTILWRSRQPARSVIKNASADALDRWLLRLSHFAQFGLLLITVGSLYFTVLPLYQKALLEEAIAQKEFELKTMNDVLARTYQQVQSSAIREFHLRGTHDCTTLWRQPPPPESLRGDEPKKTEYESAFDFNTRMCLEKIATLPQVIEGLKPEDRALLLSMVAAIAEKIDAAREVAVAKFKEAPGIITQAKAATMDLKGFRALELQLRTELLGTKATAEERRILAISLEQEATALAFEEAVRTTVLSVNFP